MEDATPNRPLSHAEYIQKLHRPSAAESQTISEIQCQREAEIDRKYHTSEEHHAAATIQKAYRGHRARRERAGLTLDPSSRWMDVIREWKFQSATFPRYGPGSTRTGSDGRPRAPSDIAKLHWQRAREIAERAGAGESPPFGGDALSHIADHMEHSATVDQRTSMLLDARYFLEMVDQKHRYGNNLMVFHEEWLRSKTDQNFFYWLDRGDGRHVDLPGCSREKLDKERVRYLSKDERKDYLVRVDDEGKLRWQKNDELITTSVDRYRDSMLGIVPKSDAETPTFGDKTVSEHLASSRHFVRQIVRTRSARGDEISETSDSDADKSAAAKMDPEEHAPQKQPKKRKQKLHVSPATILNHLMRKTVRPGTWIYVSDTVGRLYVGIKSTGTFQHASFLSGARISSAGLIGIEDGQLTYLSPLSGHYRPTAVSFTRFVDSLKNQGVDLERLRISRAYGALHALEVYERKKGDVQHLLHNKGRSDEGGRGAGKGTDDLAGSEGHDLGAVLHATSEVEQHWDEEHRRGLPKLMGELHLRRKKDGDGNEEG